jgi:hypothetical protein
MEPESGRKVIRSSMGLSESGRTRVSSDLGVDSRLDLPMTNIFLERRTLSFCFSSGDSIPVNALAGPISSCMQHLVVLRMAFDTCIHIKFI